MKLKIALILAVSAMPTSTGRAQAYDTNDVIVRSETNAARTVVVTNWVYPSPQYRYVGSQLVDVNASPLFQSVYLPPTTGFRLEPYTGGPIDSTVHYLTLVAHLSRGDFRRVVTIRNYAFMRSRWTIDRGWKPLGGFLSTRAILISASTNYDTAGVIRSIAQLYDCGTPLTEPVCVLVTNVASARGRNAAAKTGPQGKILNWNQEQAEKGHAFGLLRMGERYRDGDGVPKDLTKARDYFSKAAAAGSTVAAEALSKLNQVSTNVPATQ